MSAYATSAFSIQPLHGPRTHWCSTQIWAELHERAFRRLGGAVRTVVLDNLKEGVLSPVSPRRRRT